MPTSATREPEQLSLFDITETGDSHEKAQSLTVITVPVASPADNAPKATGKKDTRREPLTARQRLDAITAEQGFKEIMDKINAAGERNLKAIIGLTGAVTFNLNCQEHIYDRVLGTRLAVWRCVDDDRLSFGAVRQYGDITFTSKESRDRGNPHVVTIDLAYVSGETADTVVIPIEVRMRVIRQDNWERTGLVDGITVGKPFIPAKLIKNLCFVQPEGRLQQIILKRRPWIKDWLLENPGFDLRRYLSAPWLETLSKAGYRAVSDRFLNGAQYIDDKEIENLNRLCGPGTKPKDIFKCSKAVYSVLKDETNLRIWDTIRRLDKKDQITGDSILIVYRMGLQPKEMETLNSILGQSRGGKPLFTVATLVNYLNRLDMYEAISTREALPLLNDYLHMCRTLDMPPRVDGDSLKREHDIAARLCRERRDQIAAEAMREREEKERKEIEEGNSKLAKAEYHEGIYFIRPITGYDDLMDEAIQQHNCVASYAGRIASGQSRIFTMRETARPETSLVTIELSPDCKTIRQKFLAYNQPVRNKAMTEFIERWHRRLNAA